MKISTATPPAIVLATTSKIWGSVPPSNVNDIVYTYGDTIYTTKETLPKDVLVHEAVHFKQQGDMPEVWWARYATDLKFRYEQELEAYRVQYKYLVSSKGKRTAFLYAESFATSLSGKMYGSVATKAQAVLDITRK